MRASVWTAAALFFGAVAALAGCATDSHVHKNAGTAIDQDERRARIALPESLSKLKAERRLPTIAVDVAVVEEKAGADGAGAGAGANEEDGAEALPFDRRAIGEELVELLRATGVFENVVAVGVDRDRPDFYLAAEEARAAAAVLLVEARVERPRLRRTERSFVIPLIVWTCSGFPSMWLHNHTYELDFGLRLRLHDLNTEQRFEPLLEPAVAREELSFHERTSSVWTYLLTNVFPSPFCPIDETKVARALLPVALERPATQFLEHLERDAQREVYMFTEQQKGDGPAITVKYPQAGQALQLLKGRVRYSFVADAGEGATIREVRLDDRVVFPARSRVGSLARRRVPLEFMRDVGSGKPVLVTVRDSRGRERSTLVFGTRAAAAKAPALK